MSFMDPSMSLVVASGGDPVKLFDVLKDSGDPCILTHTLSSPVLENDHLNTVGKFHVVKPVPLHFSHEDEDRSLKACVELLTKAAYRECSELMLKFLMGNVNHECVQDNHFHHTRIGGLRKGCRLQNYIGKRCGRIYGFLPCADTVLEGIFLILLMYTYALILGAKCLKKEVKLYLYTSGNKI
ncbi:hypothetical protein Tco_0587913 [Tanacetum coccineum]